MNERNPAKIRGLSGSALKSIAAAVMLLDHIGASVLLRWMKTYGATAFMYPTYQLLRAVGRLAFPMFCFFLVVGFFHTRGRSKYAARLFVFALLSEVPFDLAINGTVLEFYSQNVFFTLCLGLLTIWLVDLLASRIRSTAGVPAKVLLCCATAAAVAFFSFLGETVLCSDYGMSGILCIVTIYFFYRFHPALSFAAGSAVLTVFQPLEIHAFWGLIPLYFYNGTRGKEMKYFFYCFYPCHLLVLGLICTALKLH